MSQETLAICAHVHANPDQTCAVVPSAEFPSGVMWCATCATAQIETLLATGTAPRAIAAMIQFDRCSHIASMDSQSEQHSKRCGLCYVAVAAGIATAWTLYKTGGDLTFSNRIRASLRGIRKRFGSLPLLSSVGDEPESD
jgi:hypothetical protein